MTEEIKPVATYLTPEELEDLEAIKRYYGTRASAEMLRRLIIKEARAIREAAPLLATDTQAA